MVTFPVDNEAVCFSVSCCVVEPDLPFPFSQIFRHLESLSGGGGGGGAFI